MGRKPVVQPAETGLHIEAASHTIFGVGSPALSKVCVPDESRALLTPKLLDRKKGIFELGDGPDIVVRVKYTIDPSDCLAMTGLSPMEATCTHKYVPSATLN